MWTQWAVSGGSRVLRGVLMGNAILACGASAAAAQDAGGTTELETVVVTAERREQTIMEVPQAVQALTAEALQNSQITNLEEALELVPGASIGSKMTSGTVAYGIRGLTASETTGDATVGFYLDDFAWSIPGAPFAPSPELYDLQRVEVLRGPSGTLYGQGSLGGTVKVVSNNPDLYSFNGSARVMGAVSSIASPSHSEDLMVNLPLIEGTLAVRGVISYDYLGGYVAIPALGLKDANKVASLSGRLKLLYQPTDKLSILLSYWGNTTDQGYQNRIDGYDPPYLTDTAPGKYPWRYTVYDAQISYDLGFASLLSDTGFMRQSSDLFSVGYINGLGNYTVSSPTTSQSLVQDLRLTSQGDPWANYIVGFFFQNAYASDDQSLDLPDTGFKQFGNTVTKSTSWAIYGEVSKDFFEKSVTVTLGGRYYREHRKLDQDTSVLEYGPPPVLTGPFTGSVAGTHDTFNPRINVAWHPNEQGMVYVEAAKGFRSGAIQPESNIVVLRENLGVNSPPDLAPDTMWNYQVGTKWSLFDNRLQLELAAYMFQWSQPQLEFAPLGTNLIVQVGNVHAHGLDLSAAWQTPIEGLVLRFAGNLNETTLRDVQPQISAAAPWLHNGNQLPGTSKMTGSLIVDYIHPLADTGYNFQFNGRFTYRDPQQSLSSGQTAPASGLLNLRAGVGNDLYDLSLFVHNVTDSRGPLRVNTNRYSLPYPRQIGLELNAKF